MEANFGSAGICPPLREGETLECLLGQHRAVHQRPNLASAPGSERGETVLIVDGGRRGRMLIAEVPKDLSATAIEAADAITGLKVMQSDVRIDLPVVDVDLPSGMNGRRMASAHRVDRPDLKTLSSLTGRECSGQPRASGTGYGCADHVGREGGARLPGK